MSDLDAAAKLLEKLQENFLQRDLCSFQTVSYNTIMSMHLPAIIVSNGRFRTQIEDGDKVIAYNLTMHDVETKMSPQTPSDAHQHMLNYTCDIFVSISLDSVQEVMVDGKMTEFPHQAKVTHRILLAKMPIMTGYDPNSLYDVRGAFIIRGKLRASSAIKTEDFDRIRCFALRDCTTVQIRSSHPDKPYRATSTIDLFIKIGDKRIKNHGWLGCRLPFIRKPISVGILAIALGFSVEYFIQIIRLAASTMYKPDIFSSYEVYLQQFSEHTQQEALVAVHDLYTTEAQKNSQLNVHGSADPAVAASMAPLETLGPSAAKSKKAKPKKEKKRRAFSKPIEPKTEKEKIASGLNQMKNEFLPHLNGFENERFQKLFYFASSCAVLIASHHHIIDIPPRDLWAHSQITTAANHLASLFRLLFNQHFRQKGKQLRRYIREHKLTQIASLGDADYPWQNCFIDTKLTEKLAQSVATGEWSPYRKGVTMNMSSSNRDAIRLQLRRISSALSKTDGAHANARNVPRDEYGLVDPNYSPEGPEAGLVFELALTATITPPVSPFIRKKTCEWFVRACTKEGLLTPLGPEILGRSALKPNERFLMDATGNFSHIVHDVDRCVEVFRQIRRKGDRFTFIADMKERQHLLLLCHEGLLARPLIVANRFQEFLTRWQREQFRVSFEECISEGIIEYVCAHEQSTLCCVANTPADLMLDRSCTHLEMMQASFQGTLSSEVPFLTCEASPRISLVCGHLKAVITAQRQKPRGAANGAYLAYAFEDLVRTQTSLMQNMDKLGRGIPAVVGIWPHGANQEDACLVSDSFSQLGGMACLTQNKYQSEAATPPNNASHVESFGKPADALATKTTSYEYLTSYGVPAKGTHIQGDSIVIGKTDTVTQQPNFINRPISTTRCISTASRSFDSGTVSTSQIVREPAGAQAVVVIETWRNMNHADKATSYDGNKTIGVLTPHRHMPFVEFGPNRGMTLDIVVSQVGIIGRNVPGFLVQGITGKAICLCGDKQLGRDMQDYSSSKLSHIEKMEQILQDRGFSPSGEEVLRSGLTGDRIVMPVWIGIVSILRLSHIADLKIHSRGTTGPVSIDNRQPPSGRKNKGGGKSGEMELHNFAAYGAARISQERYCDMSDYFEIYVCQNCEFLVDDVGPDIDYAFCRRCGSMQDILEIPCPFTFLFMLDHLLCLGIIPYMEVSKNDLIDFENVDFSDFYD